MQTHHNRYTSLMRDADKFFVVGDGKVGVREALAKDELGVLVDQIPEVARAAIHEFCPNAKARQQTIELGKGAAVDLGGGDNVVAGFREGHDGHQHGGRSGGDSHGALAVLQRSHAFFEDIDCWLLFSNALFSFVT